MATALGARSRATRQRLGVCVCVMTALREGSNLSVGDFPEKGALAACFPADAETACKIARYRINWLTKSPLAWLTALL